MIQVVKTGFINGKAFSGNVMQMDNMFVASIIEAEVNGFAEHYTQTCVSFDVAKNWIEETWTELTKKSYKAP